MKVQIKKEILDANLCVQCQRSSIILHSDGIFTATWCDAKGNEDEDGDFLFLPFPDGDSMVVMPCDFNFIE